MIINPEIYQRLDDMMNANNFCLIPLANYNKDKNNFSLSLDAPKRNLESLDFFRNGKIINYEVEADNFWDTLSEEFQSWPENLFREIYEKNNNLDIAKVLRFPAHQIRYLIHPETLDRVNGQSLDKINKQITHEDVCDKFFTALYNHPNWEYKKDRLKSFLLENKRIKIYNKLNPENTFSLVNKVAPCEVYSYSIHYGLLPPSDNSVKKNIASHRIIDINKYFDALIKDFLSYNKNLEIEGIYTHPLADKSAEKKVSVLSKNEKLADALIEIFLQRLEKDVKEKTVLEYSSLSQKEAKSLMEQAEKLSFRKSLEDNLEVKSHRKTYKI